MGDENQDVPTLSGAVSHGGQGGNLLTQEQWSRSDARTVAQYLSCGAVPEEMAERLVKIVYSLAFKAAKEERYREFAALFRAICSAAKLNAERTATKTPVVAIENNVGLVGQSGSILDEKRSLQVERERLLIEQMRGDWVKTDIVVRICQMFGQTMAEIIQMAADVNEDLAGDIHAKIEALEPEINQQLSDGSD